MAPSALSFHVQRLGTLMAPQGAQEALGICNPGGARGPDGAYYIFPRQVAAGNHSQIGIARVRYGLTLPIEAERLGVALEPDCADDALGCEDARVTYLQPLGRYVMTYTAYSSAGPRIAFATSRDLMVWTKEGVADLGDGSAIDNKDGVLFPEPVRAPDGSLALALLHRPMRQGTPLAIWISYAPLPTQAQAGGAPWRPAWSQHTLLYSGREPWEADRIGAGAPPARTARGWLVLYHGVEQDAHGRIYSAGALLLSLDDPRRILERTDQPLFRPQTTSECEGTVARVVFPTALDPQPDGSIDTYYGAADAHVDVIRLLPLTPPEDPA